MQTRALILLALSAFVMTGCIDSSGDTDGAVNNASVDAASFSDADPTGQSEQPSNASQSDAFASISETDKAEIVRLGACGFASRMVIVAARLSGEPEDGIISVMKHQGAVNLTLASIVINKYPKSMNSELTSLELEFQNKFLPRLSGPDLQDRSTAYQEVNQYRETNCEFSSEDGNMAMNDFKETYESFAENVGKK